MQLQSACGQSLTRLDSNDWQIRKLPLYQTARLDRYLSEKLLFFVHSVCVCVLCFLSLRVSSVQTAFVWRNMKTGCKMYELCRKKRKKREKNIVDMKHLREHLISPV